jgi:hypothetical protein
MLADMRRDNAAGPAVERDRRHRRVRVPGLRADGYFQPGGRFDRTLLAGSSRRCCDRPGR